LLRQQANQNPGPSGPQTPPGTPPPTNPKKDQPKECNAAVAVDFITQYRADSAAVAQELSVPTENVLGLSGIESSWGRSNAARLANNFFGLHGDASAPLANGVWYTSGGVAMSTFPSYAASAKSFGIQYGQYVRGQVDPTAFAEGLVRAGFNPGKAPLGNPNFVRDTASTIVSTRVRMQCR
jgi:membrane-bound lytic murein transglycosylase B